MSKRVSKRDAIASFANTRRGQELLRQDNDMIAFEYELRNYIARNDWYVGAFGRETGENDIEGSARYTAKIAEEFGFTFTNGYDDYDDYDDDDDYEEDYRAQAAEAERQRRAQATWEAQQAAERRRQWEAEQRRREAQQRQWEAERQRQREEERQRQLEAERQRQREEERRQRQLADAKARNEHITLMDRAIQLAEQGRCREAYDLASRAWEIQPMVGLQYVGVLCWAADCCPGGDPLLGGIINADAVIRHLLEETYPPSSKEYLKLATILLESFGQGKYFFTALDKIGGVEAADNRLLPACLKSFAQQYVDRHWRCKTLPADDRERFLAFLPRFQAQYEQFDLDDGTVAKFYVLLDSFGMYDVIRELAGKDTKRFTSHFSNYGGYERALVFRAIAGKAFYEAGDYFGAQIQWLGSLASRTFGFSPLMIAFFGFDEHLLNEPELDQADMRRKLRHARDYLNGRITASQYFPAYFLPGWNWQDAMGMSSHCDYRWCCDKNGEWSLEQEDFKTPLGSMIDRGKNFLRGLFDR